MNDAPKAIREGDRRSPGFLREVLGVLLLNEVPGDDPGNLHPAITRVQSIAKGNVELVHCELRFVSFSVHSTPQTHHF